MGRKSTQPMQFRLTSESPDCDLLNFVQPNAAKSLCQCIGREVLEVGLHSA